MSHALVIYPWITDFKLYDEWMHPLGLYFIIDLLRRCGYQTVYHTCLKRHRLKRWHTADFVHRIIVKPPLYKAIPRYYKCYGETPTELASFLGSIPAPDVVYVGSGMTYWIIGLEQTVKAVRDVFPSVPLIIGGTSAILIPEILERRFPDATIWPRRLEDGTLPPLIDRTMAGSSASTQWTPSLISALQIVAPLSHGPALTSLGCPLKCSYCASQLIQGSYRRRPADLVLAEIEFLVSRGVKDIAFYDDALLYRAEDHFLPLMELMLSRGIKARFHTPNGLHLSEITPEIARILRRAGFVTLRFGYESGDPRFDNHTSRKANREMLREKTSILIDAGFCARDIGVYVMAGIQAQRPNDVLADIEFVSSLGFVPKPVFLSPVPRTPLFEIYARLFPQIRSDPLTHNDAYFVSLLEGWSMEEMQSIITRARRMPTLHSCPNTQTPIPQSTRGI